MLLNKVKKTVNKYDLFRRGDSILVAYSGGADSSALLSVLLELKAEWLLTLTVAHFNHKLRKGAEEDERFVRSISAEYSLPLIVGSEDVRSYARTWSLNLEEAGRKLRYEFLGKAAKECGAVKIATGHTMTDQAETFLMRLLRGSGAQGLGGIHPVVDGKIIRPLIEVEREEVEAYCRERILQYSVDESNLDRRFLRNRVRLELIPFLKARFEPKIVSHLSQLTSILREEDLLLDSLGKEKAEMAISEKDSRMNISLRILSSLPRALKRRVMRNFILKVKGDLRGVSFSEVEALLELNEGKECPLNKDLVFKREGGVLFLKETIQKRISYKYLWDGESPLEIRELRLRFRGKKMRKTTPFSPDFDDQSHAFLDWGRLVFPLKVRSRLEGDRYRPLGAPGRKKLKEIMRAKGVVVSERERRPVFLSGDDIVWVKGLPVSEKFKVSRSTRKIFLIQKI